MSYISYGFIIFTSISLIMYALLPPRSGRMLLLITSLLFVFLNGGLVPLFLLFAETAIAYITGLGIDLTRKHVNEVSVKGSIQSNKCDQGIQSNNNDRINQNCQSSRKAGCGMIIAAVTVHILILFYLKYRNFPIYTIELISQITGRDYYVGFIDTVSVVGISYYTLMLISYEADVYMGKYRAEREPLRLLLYASFFPHIIQGPIDSYDEAKKTLFKQGGIEYSDFISGTLRLCYGLIKKLVVSERIAIFVNVVFADYNSYSAFILILAAFGFTLRLYTDFSGCMDICLGISRIFGIRISENFRNPLFSQSIAEFWRRWHITLGTFFRKYVYIPLSGNRGGRLKKFRNNLIVFFLSGLWHGGNWTFVIGVGLLQSFYMIAGECLMPLRAGILSLCGISADSKAIRVIRSLWVFILISIGFVFFNSVNAASGFEYLKAIATGQESMYEYLTLYDFGLNVSDIIIIGLGLMAIFSVEYFQETGTVGSGLFCQRNVLTEQESVMESSTVRDCAGGADICNKKTALNDVRVTDIWHNKTNLAENLILLSIVIVILFGCYGRGYDASAFIYSMF